MTRDLRRDPPLPRLVLGLAIAAAGVIFWLDRMGRIDARDYWQWWPLVAVGLGLAQLSCRKWFAAVWWLLVGGYFLLPMFGLPRYGLFQILGLWPLLISVGGVTLIIHALREGERSFTATAVMAGNVRRVGALFKGGEAVAVMGGCDIDLSNATINGEAVLDVLAFWGGIGIRVPRGWNVVDRVTPILGGVENRTTRAADDAPRLIIRGSAIMGGVEVKHPKERKA